MATAVGSEDEFRCSICLDLFNNPVTTPCGHNFCKACISANWDLNFPHECPLCKERFYHRPILKINTLISEMVGKIKSSQKAQAGPGDVSCDVCSEPKYRAVKSCLDCAASYCQNHLDPHLSVPRLKIHDLIRPVQDLKDRMCPKHGQPLKQFCRTDQSFICGTCRMLPKEHKSHKVVSLKEEWDQRKSSLNDIQTKCQQMVEQRRRKIQKFQRDSELAETYVDGETSRGLKVFTAVMQIVQRKLDQFLDSVQEKKKQSQKHLQDLTQQLKQEIFDLEKRISEVEQLQHSDDYFHSLHYCSALTVPAGLTDWSTLRFRPAICTVSASQALSELKEHVTTEVNKCDLEKVQQFAVDVSLDPDTAHGNLSLSADLKKVHYTDEQKKLPDSPLRFTHSPGVLGKQSFSKFYFEVEVRGKTEWDIGVALESVNRKGPINLNPQSGYWSIALREGSKYYACTGERLSLRSAPQKVGVFVDCNKHMVSFYGVDTTDLIHCFRGCRFTKKLLPFCSPGFNSGGKNSSPLVFTAVECLQNPPKKQKR